MKSFKCLMSKIVLVFTMALMFGFLGSSNVQAATLGQVLTTPEAGWKRYNDSDNNITYIGSWKYYPNASYSYSSDNHETNIANDSFKFNFIGSKVRLIACLLYNRSNDITIKIDGSIVEKASQSDTNTSSSTSGNMKLYYEKTGLAYKEHYVEVICNTSGLRGYMDVDAIDIDDTGKLVPYDYTNLTATSSTTNSTITLKWDTVNGANGYNVKRSATQGSGYTTIASNVTGATFNDTTVQGGTIYYYVVTPIVNGVEGTPSNEASATANKNITPPADNNGNAILTITMTNGNIKTYTVSMTKVNDFISWYNNRASGSNGSPYYSFDKTDNLQPFTKKTEYVVFDKISSFELDEYAAQK